MSWTIKAAIGVVAGVLLLSGCYWSQPGFGPDNQNSNPSVRDLGPARAATLHPVWSRSFTTEPTAPVESAGGRLHVAVNRPFDGFAGQSSVETLDQRTGTTAWRYVEAAFGWYTELVEPVMVGSDLYVGYVGIHGGDFGKRYDPATGAIVESDVAWGEASVRGSIVVRRADETVTDWFRYDLEIIDTSGAGRGWMVSNVSSVRPTSATVSDDAAFVVEGNRLGRYDYPLPAAGRAAECQPGSWEGAPPGFFGCDPLVNAVIAGVSAPVLSTDQSTVYVTSPTAIHALDADDLSTKWTAAVPGGIVGPPTIAGDTLYVATGSSLTSMPVAGCGSATCTPSWSTALAGAAVDRPTVADGVVYVVSRPSDATDGDVLEAFDAEGASGSPPILSTPTGLAVKDSPVVTTRDRLFLTGSAVGVDPAGDEGRLVAYGPA